MLVELAGLELRQAAYTFWLYSNGLVQYVLCKDGLGIFDGMFLNVFFEPHEFISPLWNDHGANVAPVVFEIVHNLIDGVGLQGEGVCDGV